MDKRKLKSRSRLQGALKILLGEKELRQITIEDLCNEAKVTRPTFYANYRDLPDMLDEYLGQMLQSLEALYWGMGAPSEAVSLDSRLVRLIEIILDSLDRDDPRMIALFSNTPVIIPEYRFTNLVLKIFEQIKEEEEGRVSPEKRLIVAHYFTGALLGMIRLWMKKPEAISPSYIAEIFSELTARGGYWKRRGSQAQ